MPSVTDQPKEADSSEAEVASKGYSILSPADEKNEGDISSQSGERNNLELMAIRSHNSHESFDEGLVLEDLKVLSLRLASRNWEKFAFNGILLFNFLNQIPPIFFSLFCDLGTSRI